MKEADYINATNLAKIRIAWRTLADCSFPKESGESKEQKSALIVMQAIIDRLERKVRT